MGFGSADLTYFFPENICFKLINIISMLGKGEGQEWGDQVTEGIVQMIIWI